MKREMYSMPNPRPIQNEEFKAKQFKAVGEVPEGVKLGKVAIAAKVPEDVEQLILALPRAERITWIRRVLTEAARKELT
jgi:hypothetical protein